MKKALLFVILILPTCAIAQDRTVPVPPTGNVTLPLDEYNHLMELASKPARKTDTPPVPYILKCAEVKLRAANESLQGTIHLQGDILHKGETKIPLTTGMAILDARQPCDLTPDKLLAHSRLSLAWNEQRTVLGFA